VNDTYLVLNTTNKIKQNENGQNLLITKILQNALNHEEFWKLNHEKTKKGRGKNNKKTIYPKIRSLNEEIKQILLMDQQKFQTP